MRQYGAIRGILLTIAVGINALAQQAQLPPLKRQAGAEAVVKEHLEAINSCDWNRLLAQYPDDDEIFSPGGVLAQGRRAVAGMFAQVVKQFRDG